MSGFQQVIVLGRLGNDPETKYTQSGTAVVSFSLATSRRRKDAEGNTVEVTAWHRCKAFGSQAELIAERVRKGQRLFVEGRLEYWQAKTERGQVSVAEVIVEHFEFADGMAPRGGDDAGDDRSARSTQARDQARRAVHGDSGPQAFDQPFDDDIPF